MTEWHGANSIGRHPYLVQEVSDGSSSASRGQGRYAQLRSPGHRSSRGVSRRRTCQGEIAKGLLAEEAAEVVGVAPAVGARWFRRGGGGMAFDIVQQPSGRYLSFVEREEIMILKEKGKECP